MRPGRSQAQLVDLNSVVRRLEPAPDGGATRSEIILEQRLYGDLDPIAADVEALERLVLHLTGRARDAMPKGGTLTIETDTVFLDRELVARWPGMGAGAYSMLLISDTRPARRDASGVAESLANDLGEARKLAEQAGGRAEMELIPGKGRVCRIYFPAMDPERTGVAPSEGISGYETILLVDDTEPLREMIQRLLDGFGYTVLVAKDGAQALQVAEKHHAKIDLLLSDVVMPGIGGPELAVRLRMRRPGLRVLLMSGYDEYSLASGAGGYSSFIAKPFRPEVLGMKIREVLDATAARPSS